jgi:predicted PurR-regulated permease PerM
MEQRVLARLGRMNRTVVFVAVLAYVFAALLIPGLVGAVLLIALAVALTWLLARTWDVTPSNPRAMRVVILVLLTIVAGIKFSF